MSTPISLDGAAALGDWGVIRATGADAASFLHSQLTNDVLHLHADQARLAGYCSAKGRLLASFIMWRAGDDLMLACRADLLAPTLKRLSMFVLRAKCKLTDASADVALVGLAGPSAKNWTAAGEALPIWGKVDAADAALIRLPDANGQPRYLWAGTRDAAPTMPALPSGAWAWSDVLSGIPMVEAATVEQFVPQMINYEILGGIDFQKGCYPGQEVVARSQYRGTIKRRTLRFDSPVSAVPGQEVFHSAEPDQPAGLVVNAASRQDGTGAALLVEVKLAALETGSLHLGGVDGAVLVPAPLPYAFPAAEQ